MTRTSLLDSVDLKDRIGTLTQQQLDEAAERRSAAFTSVIMTIEDLAENIADQHRKPVDGLIAEATYLERLDAGLKDNRDQITAGFSSPQPSSNQNQAVELEAVRGQLAEAENANADLQRSARRVSELEITNGQLERDKSSLESQLAAAQAEVSRLKAEADKPNPLQAANQQLTQENQRLTREKKELEAQVSSITERLTEANARADAAEARLAQAAEIVELHPEEDHSSEKADTDTSGNRDMIGGFEGVPAEQAKKPGLLGRAKDALKSPRVDRRQG